MKIKCIHFKLISLLAIFLSGCWEIKYKDISSSPQGQEIIGSEYIVSGKVYLYGHRESSTSPPTEAFLWAGTRIAGPEIAFEKEVPIGTKISVTSLLKTSDIPILSCRRALIVSVEGMEIPESLPVIVDLVVKNKGKNCSPNKDFYRPYRRRL